MKSFKITWTFVFSQKAREQFNKLDKDVQKRIQKSILKLIDTGVNPKEHMKPLTGPLRDLYSLRVETYRILCSVNSGELIIMALSLGHRRDVYKRS
jgi:mRNA interferase RelE/StbE